MWLTQEGNNVKISVPDATFNPGSNKFDYELVRTKLHHRPMKMKKKGDDYTPSEVEREVSPIGRWFSIGGEYSTTQIGSKDKQTVKVNDLSTVTHHFITRPSRWKLKMAAKVWWPNHYL